MRKKKNAAAAAVNTNAEIFEALRLLEKERGIPVEYMTDRITQALIAAYKASNKKETGCTGENVVVEFTEQELRMYARKTVVEELSTPSDQILLEAARRIDPNAQPGDVLKEDVKTQDFGRIAAQTAKQVIIQGIREAERGMVFDSFSSKEHEILTGTVSRVDPNSGDIHVHIGQGSDRTEGYLGNSEQVKGELYKEGDIVRVYVVEVRRSSRGPQILVSRTHPGLVKRLFELNVPEVESGEVEIRSIAREAGSRTKLAVYSNNPDVDPVGACVGPHSSRIDAVTTELNGEKIDIVNWYEDPGEFVASALNPAKAIAVTLLPGTKACRVIVPDTQLSLAIGKEGQNARLAARLTGYKIDIKPESQAEEE